MRCASLFSGVGGMDLGLHRAGIRHEFFCEADAYRRAVLARHWTGVPVHEDVRDLGEPAGRGAADGSRASAIGRGREAGAGLPGDPDRDRRADARADLGGPQRERGRHGPGHTVDLLAGGFPCQDLSVAGNRAGLNGARSGLFHEFARIAGQLVRPGGWVLIENVPGLLSSHGGRDFAIVLATLAELGFHDLAWLRSAPTAAAHLHPCATFSTGGACPRCSP